MDYSFKYKIYGDTVEEELINENKGDTLWQQIYLHLKKLGYDVYSVGQKIGKCTDSYIVIKENGIHAIVDNISGYKLFDIAIYHPIDRFSTLEFYVEDVKKTLKYIKDLKFTGNETPITVDDKLMAYTTSIEYKQFKKLRR